MASSEDSNFKRSLCSRGRSKAQMTVGKILDTISAAAAAPPNSQTDLHRNEELQGETVFGRKVEKRGLLNIDLNIAPPQDGDFVSPVDNNGGIGLADDVNEVGFGYERERDLNRNCGDQNGFRAHWFQVENDGFCENIIADPEIEIDEKNRKLRCWKTLLEVAETALCEHDESIRNKEETFGNRKRKMSQEAELGGELHKGTTRKKFIANRRQNFATEWVDEPEVAAVVRSTRGRAVAMPNKYKDSVLDTVAEAVLPPHNKSGKSAGVVSTRRKSR